MAENKMAKPRQAYHAQDYNTFISKVKNIHLKSSIQYFPIR